MVLSTSQLRQAYAPACRDSGKNFLAAYRALDACLRKWGYRPDANTGAYNCRQITGGSGYSLHAYPDDTSFSFWNGRFIPDMALAVDINPTRNPYGPRLVTDMPRGMVTDILNIRTNSGAQVWGWGGYYSGNKDAMHYEIVCHPNDLATGIRASTVPGGGTTAEEFHLSTEQYNDIKARLARIEARVNEIESEETRRFTATMDNLNKIADYTDGLVSTIRSSGTNVANAVRRMLGVDIKEGGSVEQGNADLASGTRFKNHFG